MSLSFCRQASEYLTVEALKAGFKASHIIADKGYDSDAFVLIITGTGAQAVIPPRSNRKEQRFYDAELYKERNLVERFLQKAKRYRRIATRYEQRLAQTTLQCLLWSQQSNGWHD